MKFRQIIAFIAAILPLAAVWLWILKPAPRIIPVPTPTFAQSGASDLFKRYDVAPWRPVRFGPPTFKAYMSNVVLSATVIASSGMSGTDAVFHDGDYSNIGSSFTPSSYLVFDLGAAYVLTEARVYFTGSSPGESVLVEGSNASDMSGAVTLATVAAGSPGMATDAITDPSSYRYLRFTGSGYLAAEEVEAESAAAPTRTPKAGMWRRIQQQSGR